MLDKVLQIIDEEGYTHLTDEATATVTLNATDPWGEPPVEADEADLAKVTANENGSVTYTDSEQTVTFTNAEEWGRFFGELMENGWGELSLDDFATVD